MPTLEGKVIRIACNQSSPSPALDLLSGKPPVLWQGAEARFQCALFTDEPTADSFVSDVSNVEDVQFLLRKHNATGAVLIDNHLGQANLLASSFAAWDAGTGKQFEFALSPVETNWTTPTSGNLPVYFAVVVSTAVSTYLAAFGYGFISNVGIVDVAAPVPPGLTGVTRLVGGTSIDLDFVSTLNKVKDTGIPYFVRINGQFVPVYLESGAADVNEPGEIQALDDVGVHWTRGL